jgi:glycosyltransferase involved in cell wall biosynthesis
MRICFASTLYPGMHDTWGGAEVACQRQRRLLLEAGHSVPLITSRPDRATGEPDHFVLSTIADIVGRNGARALDMLFPYDLRVRSHANSLLREIRPDVLHLHSFQELTFSLLSAARKLKIPTAFSLYDLWALCPQSNLVYYRGGVCQRYRGIHCARCAVPVRKPLVLFQKPFFKRFLPLIDRLIVLSDTVKAQLIEFGLDEKKIVVSPLPLFDNFEKMPIGNLDDRSILFAGWMIRPKGLHILIEAMPKVLQRHPQVKALIVETGAKAEHKIDFQRRIAELGLTDRFHFLGKKNSEEIKQLLAKASVVAVPEQWGIAWPIFCTEAMAFGKPIAASRIGDMPRFIQDGVTGYLFDPQSHDRLADCLISFFDNPSQALEMGKQAQEFIVRLCDNASIRSGLISYYQEISR